METFCHKAKACCEHQGWLSSPSFFVGSSFSSKLLTQKRHAPFRFEYSGHAGFMKGIEENFHLMPQAEIVLITKGILGF